MAVRRPLYWKRDQLTALQRCSINIAESLVRDEYVALEVDATELKNLALRLIDYAKGQAGETR